MVWPFSSNYPERKARDVEDQTFDYIIVGGGTAGCVLAARLTEDPTVRVLLLCRGTVEDTWFSRIPLINQAMQKDAPQVTALTSEPDERWAGEPLVSYTSRALGGASRVNSLLLTRGAPANYDHWAELGNDQWSWQHCEPWFRKMEDASACYPAADHRGRDGSLLVHQIPSSFETDKYWAGAAEDLGIPAQTDGNDPQAPAMGIFNIDLMVTRDGHRLSAMDAYLPTSLARERRGRLFVCTGVAATRLVIDQDTSRVTGVRIVDVESKGTAREYLVKAKREVVVCCGALFTPQLLMLSGIGPKEELEAHNIPVIHDLPGVGANLSDHVAFGLSCEVKPSDSYTQLVKPWVFLWHLLLFLLFKTGLLASTPTKQCIWVRSDAIDDATMQVQTRAVRTNDKGGEIQHDNLDASRVENIPDIEYMIIAAPFSHDYSWSRGYSGLFATLARPFSRGRIALASDDPLALPKLYHPLITDPRDWAVARKAARFGIRLFERVRTKGYPSTMPWFNAPGMKRGSTEGSWGDVSDEDIDAYIRKFLNASLHVTSSCRMAEEADGGVVGQDLRVHGFQNLRVADASVFPALTSAHTVAPTFLVAERCAGFIKQDWNPKSA
ncbi:choline dehydrogenase [Sodiomyces alkalinus F11]|uniref:Choline dehydrogenase n=1 Tax=Sodiomyces alkalinus (strain CBS 110278 / VKM F-3762 / F11) TaxID=1314773 RepID=A0A3N2QAQ5_SODAK|nr:choline dehydrogenase [Sodiomyces alkalinus F11]ROT43834.1 choline dehydrogenase [Sodiomyces alkalinus F11]